MYKILNIFITFCGFFLCFLMTSFAEEQTQNSDMVHMYSMEMPPYGFYDDTGMPKGYMYELTEILLKEAQFSGFNQLVPLARMINDFNRGSGECAFFAGTDYVRNNFYLVESTGQNLSIGIVPNIQFEIGSYESLGKLKIGVPVGAKLETKFDADTQLNKFYVKNYQNGSLMLYRDRIDALAGVVESIQYQISQLGVDAIQKTGTPFVLEEIGLYLTCRREGVDKLKINRLQKALIHMRETGQIGRIIAKYTVRNISP